MTETTDTAPLYSLESPSWERLRPIVDALAENGIPFLVTADEHRYVLDFDRSDFLRAVRDGGIKITLISGMGDS